MSVVTIWTVVVGIWAVQLPALELRTLAKQVTLPDGAAEKWDAIGTYTLRDGKTTRDIKLYYQDSDSIADKQRRRGGIGGGTYPNFFCIHAVYRDGDGPWKYRKLYSATRTGFLKVSEVKSDAITLRLQSKWIIFSNRPVQLSEEQIKRIYEPKSHRLIWKDGAPALEEPQ